MHLEIPPLVPALVVVLLVTLMAFMKRMSTEARKAKMRKLLLVAEEEAHRLEAEQRDYGVAFDRQRLNQCAVCFSTTTRRCSKCKAVKYCSGKCQIIHWRQGHKHQCQPPDTISSSTLVSYISSESSEADSTIFSEMQERKSFVPNLKEPKTCGSIYQRLDLYNSKISEIYASETTDLLIIGPEITKNVSAPDISDGIESTQNVLTSHMEREVPNSSIHLSSEISICNVPTKTFHISKIPDYESTLSDVRTTFTVSFPDNLNYCTPSPIGGHSVCAESPVIHVPSKNLVNVIPCSPGSTTNICNSLKNDFPASSSFSTNLTGPLFSEHELDYSSSFLHDISSSVSQMLDFPTSISPKKCMNSKIPVTDISPAENRLEQHKSSQSHMSYASSPKIYMLDSLSDISCLDLPSSSSFASNMSSSGIFGPSSPCLKYSNPLNSSSAIKFKRSEPNESNTTTLASKIQGPRISLPNSTGKSTSGTDILHCSPHRESVSIFPNLGKHTSVIEGESSFAVHDASCDPVVSGCSRSCDSTMSSSGNFGPISSCLDSVPYKSSSTSSLIIRDASCSSSNSPIKFQNLQPNESIVTILAAENHGPMVSLSSSTRKPTFATDLVHSSPHREMVSIFPISGEHTSIIEGESLVAVPLEGSHPTVNGLKRSKKKSINHPKSSKSPMGRAAGRIKESLAKSSELFFPYDSFAELFNWDNLELPPRGLINCGNSCYANVVLQCLTYTRPLAAYLLHGFHSEDCQRKDWCFMCELEHLVSKVREGESALSPIRILSGIQKLGNHLGYGKQEDAHEFLRLAIDTMQSIVVDEAGGEETVNRTTDSATFIQQLFGGYLQSKVKCKKCQYESNRYELIMDLTVEVHGSIESLEDALDQFTGAELLDGENEYKCNRCKSYVKAEKQLTVHEAPNVLTIVLKRFETGRFGKLNKIVAFPEVLDMLPYMSGIGDKPPLYNLYAVVVHLDVLNASFFGHYICYVKDLKGMWYKIDDSKVIPVSLDVVMSEGAYMLLYSRSSPRPPAVLHNEMAESYKEVPLNNCTFDVEQSSFSGGYNKETKVYTKHFPSLAIFRDASVHVDQPARVRDLDYHTMDLDSNIADRSNGYGFGCEKIYQMIRDEKIDSVPREYGDSTSTDAGSFFSGSDETSCSTDSNRDSTSTVDLAETVFGDPYLECNSLNVAEACGVSSSKSCMRSSPCLSETYSALKNYAYGSDRSFPNQQIENSRIDQGFTQSNPDTFDADNLHSLPVDSSNGFFQKSWAHSFVSESSLKHRDMLGCSVSGRSAYLLQPSQFRISNGLDHPKDNSSECFAVPAKRKHNEEKYKSDETERLKFDAPSRTYAVTNFEHFLAHDSRISAITKVHSLGFGR